ncbi:MAG: hypothetical protein H0W25_03955 [Acidimicrobiia bacterium]|nr:hypothetical protein [Acidimicrobiia bacterium]
MSSDTGEVVMRLDGGVDPNATSFSSGALWVVDDGAGRAASLRSVTA